MARTDFRFTHSIRVRWSEVDPQGIVFNAHYLTYFDVAVTDYWRALGRPYPSAFVDQGFDTFAVKATIEYKSPARFDDVIDVCLRVARFGRTSMTLAIEIHRGEEHLVTGELIYVAADAKTRKPTPVPEFLREAVAAYEKTPLDERAAT